MIGQLSVCVSGIKGYSLRGGGGGDWTAFCLCVRDKGVLTERRGGGVIGLLSVCVSGIKGYSLRGGGGGGDWTAFCLCVWDKGVLTERGRGWG